MEELVTIILMLRQLTQESDSSGEGMIVQSTSSKAAGSDIQQDDVYEACNCNQRVQVQYLKREANEANEEIRR